MTPEIDKIGRRNFLYLLGLASLTGLSLSRPGRALKALGEEISGGELGGFKSTVEEGSPLLVDDFLSSGRANSEDVDRVLAQDIVPITIKTSGGECNLVTFKGKYPTNLDKRIMYVAVVARGMVDWRRLERREYLLNDDNRLVSWEFDQDTNPETSDDKTPILTYSSKLGVQGSALLFNSPFYIPNFNTDHPDGLVVPVEDIDNSVVNALVY